MTNSAGLETLFVRLYLDRLDHFTADEMVSNLVHLEQFK
jgi:hypothetical protein